jgi:hypothetical protein
MWLLNAVCLCWLACSGSAILLFDVTNRASFESIKTKV